MSHALLISLSHEFPSQWDRLTASGDGPRSETVTITRDRFPYPVTSPSLTVMVARLDAFGVPATGAARGVRRLPCPPSPSAART